MASNEKTVNFLLDQLSESGNVTAKKMFGEYGIFLADRMIALVCDDKLYFKPTEKGRRLFPAVTEGVPYPGAKPCFLVSEEAWDDRDWLAELARTTASELPPKKPKKASKRG